MKKVILTLAIAFSGLAGIAQVGVNTNTPSASSNLTVAPVGTDGLPKGTLLSAMSSADRALIANPATGLIVYDTDVKCLMTNNGTPAAPNWSCIGDKNTNYSGLEYVKHFHYSLPDAIPVSTSDFSARTGPVNGTTQTLLSNWLATNDPTQVQYLPSAHDIRMDIEFYSKNTTGGAAYYRPLIVNTSASSQSLIGVSRADISGLYQWPIPNNMAGNSYLNIDSDQILGWSSQGVLETSISTFRILGDDGGLFRVTYWGYRNYLSAGSIGQHQIHMVLEKFKSQNEL